MNTCFAALRFEKIDDVRGRIVAKQLTERFFMKGDIVFANKGDEISRCVARESGLGKMGVGGEKIFRSAMKIGKVAAATPGNKNLLADPVGMFEDGYAPPTLSGERSTEETGGTSTKDENIELPRHEKTVTQGN